MHSGGTSTISVVGGGGGEKPQEFWESHNPHCLHPKVNVQGGISYSMGKGVSTC